MAKKTTEKDVLIVRDEKTGEISVVAGLNADGSPKRTPAKAENAQSFLQFDRHGDVLDNFFKNFFRQCKEPSRFGFYRVAADQADKLLEVMKDSAERPRRQQGDCLRPTRWTPPATKRKYRRSSPPKSRNKTGTGQPKMTNLKNRKKWNRKTNRIRKARTAGAGQPGLPTHRREQDQLAGVGGEMGREARRP